MPLRGPILFAVCCLASLAVGGARAASEGSTGISVTGNGKVLAMPTMVELAAVVKGDAELAVDAVTKYDGNKRRALETIANLQIPGLEVEDGGVSINSSGGQQAMMAAMRGMPAENTTPGLTLSEPLTLRLKGIDQLTTEQLLEILVKIVDAGKDAGMAIAAPPRSMYELQVAAQYGGSVDSPLAAFKLDDVEAVKGQAYEAAIKNARDQAQRLAELAGVKLGRVVSIREVQTSGGEQARNPYFGYFMSTGREKEYVSSGLKPIPVTVVLEVEFAIE